MTGDSMWQFEKMAQKFLLRSSENLHINRRFSAEKSTTTPTLLGLYNLVCLWAQQALESNRMSYAAAWYKKTNFKFSDAIAVIRCEIFLSHSPPDREREKSIVLIQTTSIRALLPLKMYKIELRLRLLRSDSNDISI